MTSYRSYGDTGAYRSRAGVGIGTGTFGRTTSTGSSLPNCRTSYSTVGSSRVPTKERVSGYGNAFLKKDKSEEKPTYKYSSTKEIEKSRPHSSRSSSEDVRAKSPLSSSRSSLFEKYSFPAGKTSERPASVLDRYNRGSSREKSREPDGASRYGSSTYPGSGLPRSYGSESRIEKKERNDHPPVSYRGLRPNSGRSSREPSPEVGVGKSSSFRVYSRASSYARSGTSSSTSESSSASISSRFGSTAGSRFLPSRTGNDRVPTAISYSGSDRFRTSGSKPTSRNAKDDQEPKSAGKSDTDKSQESFPASEKADEHEIEDRLQDNENVTLTMVTRGTSPTPPASSSFVRNRRADIGIALQKEVMRPRKRPESTDQEVQCDRAEEISRYSRFGSSRISTAPWSSYLDKFSPSSSASATPVYTSRGYSSASSSPRVNSFAYGRSNDSPVSGRGETTSKATVNSSQEGHRNQKEQNTKVYGGGLGYSRDAKNDSTSKLSAGSSQEHPSRDQSEAKVQSTESCSCAKSEAKGDRFPSSRTFNSDSVSRQRLDSPQPSATSAKTQESGEIVSRSEETASSRESSVSKNESYNQRRPSIPRLGRRSPKGELKIAKSSSNCSSKSDGRERRGSTPKSDISSSSKVEEPVRVVEGYCQEQSREVASQKRESLQSGFSQSRSATPQSSGSNSTKNLPRQMTRTDSSDGSAVSVPIGKSKSSSASSVTSQSAKIKATSSPPSPGKSSGGSTASSVNLRQGGSPDARGKPPVPKSDAASAAASKSNMSAKYVNKDFRKSTLNMENGDPNQSKYTRKKKTQRSMSVSSQDSQSEPNSESIHQALSSESSAESSRSRLRIPSGMSKSTLRKNDSSSSLRFEKSRSSSKSPSGKKDHREEARMSSSSGSSDTNSSNSSSSEDDDEKQVRAGSRRRRRCTSKSPFREKRGKISAGSSRTSILASSADEMSIPMDKPPRPPSSPRSRSDRSGKTEEAKSFLMRALAPVTNLFKNKHQESGEYGSSGGWLDSNEDNTEGTKKSELSRSKSKSNTPSLSKSLSFTNSERNDEGRQSSSRVRHDFSGEKPWWLDPNSDNVPEGVERASVYDDISQETTVSSPLPDDGKFKYKVWRQESGERAWWLDSNDSTASAESKKQSATISRQESGEKAWWLDSSNDGVPSEEAKKQSSSTVSLQEPGERGWWLDGNESVPSEESKRSTKVRRQQSGEQAWWLDANDNVPSEEVKRPSSSPKSRRGSSSYSSRSSDRRNRIKHQQSGERAWWMTDDPESVPEGVEVIPVSPTAARNKKNRNEATNDNEVYARPVNKIRHVDSGERPWWMDSSSNVPDGIVKIPVETSNSTSDSSESYERIDIGVNPEPEMYARRSLSRFPIEFPPPPPDEPLGDRASPEGVENPPDPPDNYGGRDSPYDNVQPTPRRSSPRKRPSTLPLFIGEHTNIDDLLGDTVTLCPSPVLSRIRKRERVDEDSPEGSSECEEIDATQVIIHDSTPQTPVIQRRNRDNERPQPDGYIPVSFAFQVSFIFKHLYLKLACHNLSYTNISFAVGGT